ncbi:hypothetical protein Mapa_016757 [Marchantia paleacea]|nr:hypothetical protein Mapa_016757 [Marchantia paleacea]
MANLLRDSGCITQDVQRELDSVVGKERLVIMSDIPSLLLVQHIVMESFRLRLLRL